MNNTNAHYMTALQEVGGKLKTHDVYVVHVLDSSQPPVFTRDAAKVREWMEGLGDSIIVYMNPVHEINNVVYFDDSLLTYTNAFKRT